MRTAISQEQKQTVMNTVLNTQNEDIITAMYDLATTEKERPCQYSNKEIENRLIASMKEEQEGKTTTIEEFEREFQ